MNVEQIKETKPKCFDPIIQLSIAFGFLALLGNVYSIFENYMFGKQLMYEKVTRFWNFVYIYFCIESDDFGWFISTNLWGFLVFWFFGLMYSYLDFVKPKWVRPYVVQSKMEDEILDWSVFKKAAKRVLFNQIVCGLLLSLILYPVKSRLTFSVDEIPSFHTGLFHLFCFIIIEEIGFYYSHRLAHEPALYKKIHKIHHEFTAPIAISARYAHFLEDIMSNLLPVVAGPLIMGSHVLVFWIWVLLAIFSTLCSHSGFHLPFLPSPEAHDFHHLKFNVNFGVLGVLDDFHGTNQKFTQNVAYLRNYSIMDFVPARTKFPDVVKKD